jgi:hypothetical protein
MSEPRVVFNGTAEEAVLLSDAIGRHCGCVFDPGNGLRTLTCAPHQALDSSQRFADGLLFVRRTITYYIDGEGRDGPRPEGISA